MLNKIIEIIGYLNSQTVKKNFTDIDESIFQLKPKLKPFYDSVNNKLNTVLKYVIEDDSGKTWVEYYEEYINLFF